MAMRLCLLILFLYNIRSATLPLCLQHDVSPHPSGEWHRSWLKCPMWLCWAEGLPLLKAREGDELPEHPSPHNNSPPGRWWNLKVEREWSLHAEGYDLAQTYNSDFVLVFEEEKILLGCEIRFGTTCWSWVEIVCGGIFPHLTLYVHKLCLCICSYVYMNRI